MVDYYAYYFDGEDDYVVYNGSYVVDDFEVDLSGWTVLTKTSDSISSVARDSTIKYSGGYSAKFDAYLDGIATNGHDWNDLRQVSFYDWSDCVGVGFLVYVPASSLGKNARLYVGFCDSDGEGWKADVIDFSSLTQEGWYYVAVYKDEITRITRDGKIDWNNAKLSIRIHSSDASLDGNTITVYIDRVEKIRYDLRNYTAVVGFMSNLKGTGNRQGILQMESYGGDRIRLFVNPDNVEFDRVRINPSWTEYGNLVGGFEVGRYYVVAGSYDGSQGKLYVNGQLVGSKTEDMSFLGNLYELRVSWLAVDKYLDGKVLFVMLYSRALSDTEIQNLYNDPNNPPLDGLKLWYAPDSVDVNGVWRDKSGNGNDGTIYGATPIPIRYSTVDIEEIWELNTLRLNYAHPKTIRNRIQINNVKLKDLDGGRVAFTFGKEGDAVDLTFYVKRDELPALRAESALGALKIRTPVEWLEYYGDYVVDSVDIKPLTPAVFEATLRLEKVDRMD